MSLDNKITGTDRQDRQKDGQDHVLSQADALTKNRIKIQDTDASYRYKIHIRLYRYKTQIQDTVTRYRARYRYEIQIQDTRYKIQIQETDTRYRYMIRLQ